MAWIENKQVVVTGATSGIGREVATRLASLGGHVVLVCRDRTRGEAVASEINGRAGVERARVMTADTSDQSSIRAFARRYRDTYGALDVLVNNAGVLLPERRTSVDGIELTFATNVLGYHLVTTELLDALKAAAPSRVVNVASTFAFAVDMDDLQFDRRPYDGLTAYAQSKALDRMLTWAFATRLHRDSVTVNALAPGLVLETRLYRDLSEETKGDLAQYGSRSVPEGADTAVWLASTGELGGVTGRFFEKGTEKPCEFRDEEAEERLWQACERLVGHLARSV
jgi:NAD(P)-dependent dehydrogenase (short-subunit alcohol dehydrogenase family)